VRELAENRTKLIQQILKQAQPIISSIGEEEGYSMILDQSAVLWSDRTDDLTPKLNARMK